MFLVYMYVYKCLAPSGLYIHQWQYTISQKAAPYLNWLWGGYDQ